MRKFLLVVVLLCGCLLFGCKSRDAVELENARRVLARLGSGFESDASIAYGALEAEADIARASPLGCTVTFSAPETLAEMAFVFREDNVDVLYKGLAFSFAAGMTPGRTVAKTLVSAINAAGCSEPEQISANGDILEVTGVVEAGEFLLSLDGQTGGLRKLSVPDEDLEIDFTGFRFLE